jgi:hypothetical protein
MVTVVDEKRVQSDGLQFRMLFVLCPCVCFHSCRHFEPNGTHWNQVGSNYSLPNPGDAPGYQGYSMKISSDGLTVLVGDPAVNAMTGDVALFARASTALVGGVNQQQFELRARHFVTPSEGSVFGADIGLSGDGTQVAIGGQQRHRHRHRRADGQATGRSQFSADAWGGEGEGELCSGRSVWLTVIHSLFVGDEC